MNDTLPQEVMPAATLVVSASHALRCAQHNKIDRAIQRQAGLFQASRAVQRQAGKLLPLVTITAQLSTGILLEE